MTWWCTGVRWRAGGGPVLGWYAPGLGRRESALAAGDEIAFRVRGGRRCLGVWRAGRWTACPAGAAVAGRVTRAQCEECARVDRAHSVAADTFADDPRPYHVYVAWFGPGLVKVGVTGVARGGARLLEQGAVAYTWLGRGPLMAARRTEELLRTALGVPDRIPYGRKRALRARLPGVAERAGELTRVHRDAVALGGWPESLERLACDVVDHGEVFGLDALSGGDGLGGACAVGGSGAVGGLGTANGTDGPGGPGSPDGLGRDAVLRAPSGLGAPGDPDGLGDAGWVVDELTDGGVVAGTLVAAAGPDLHLVMGAGAGVGVGAGEGAGPRALDRGTGRRQGGQGGRGRGRRGLVIDSRLMSGWRLVGLEDGAASAEVTVPVRGTPVVQTGLF